MRFAHTADWHLGRLFHQTQLTEDQAYALDGMVRIIRDASVDAVLIAGDLYDRAVPPPEAVALLDDVLCRIAIGLNVPVVLIAGNHDSPQRLSFASRLLEIGRVHVFGTPSTEVGSVAIHDRHGVVRVHALPYAEPAVVRQCFGDDSVACHESAMRRLVQAIAPPRAGELRAGGTRNILLAHAFVTGGADCESERPLSVGGAGTVDASCFTGFDYVALGHLHEPQSIGGDRVNYSGSLMKYSFSECEHRKSISIVEMDGAGNCTVERVPLKARRDVRRIRGLLAELLKGPPDGESRDDYIEVTLDDDGALLDPISKLRQVYPNVLNLVRPRFTFGGTIGSFDALRTGPFDNLRTGSFDSLRTEIQPVTLDPRAVDEDVLFGRFFQFVTGAELTAEQEAVFSNAVSSLRLLEREAAA